MDKESTCNAGDAGDMGLMPGLGRSPGWEDPLEEGVATHFSVLAWRIAWTEDQRATVHGAENSRAQVKRLSTQACTYDPERQSL